MRIEALFPKSDQATAAELLTERCGDGLPLTSRASEMFWDRVRFAVLKLSGGDLTRLRREVDAANRDWRDTLMAAGFGESTTIHEEWYPSRDEKSGRQ